MLLKVNNRGDEVVLRDTYSILRPILVAHAAVPAAEHGTVSVDVELTHWNRQEKRTGESGG